MVEPTPLFTDRAAKGRTMARKVTPGEFIGVFNKCLLDALVADSEEIETLLKHADKDERAARVRRALETIHTAGCIFADEHIGAANNRRCAVDEALIGSTIPAFFRALNVLVDEKAGIRTQHYEAEDIEPLLHTALRDASIETFKTNIFATPSLKR